MLPNPEHSRLRDLLTDTITLLCKNGLQYEQEFSVQALIGITLDKKDVFLVDINEIVQSALAEQKNAANSEDVSQSDSETESKSRSPRKRKRKLKSNNSNNGGGSGVKQARSSDSEDDNDFGNDFDDENDMAGMKREEKNDDIVYVKHEPGTEYDTNYPAASGNVYPNMSASHMNPLPEQQFQAGGDAQVWSDTSMNTTGTQDPSQQNVRRPVSGVAVMGKSSSGLPPLRQTFPDQKLSETAHD